MKTNHEQTMTLWVSSHRQGFQLRQHPMMWGVLAAMLVHLMVLGALWSRKDTMASMAGQPAEIHVAMAMISRPQPPAVRPPGPKPVETPQPAPSVQPQVLTAEQSHRQEHLPTVFKPRVQAPKQRLFTKQPEPKIQPEHRVESLPQQPVIQEHPAGNPNVSAQTTAMPQFMQAPLPVDSTAIHCVVPEPVYPPKARWLHQEGLVRIRVIINPQGQLTSSTIIQHSGSDLLDQAAITAIRSTHCQPYLQQGKAVRVTTIQPFLFRLAS
jgi:protein TonB